MTRSATVVIDTSSSYSILAILLDAKVFSCQIITEPKTLLREIGLFSLQVRAEIDRIDNDQIEIVLCVGPSGFSGGRIGVATGRSLALGWGKGVIAFDHLEMMSYIVSNVAPHDFLIEDAKGGEVHLFDNRIRGSSSITLSFDDADSTIGQSQSVTVIGALPKGWESLSREGVRVLDVNELPIESKIASFVDAIKDRQRVSPDKLKIRYGREYVAVANFEKLR